MGFGLLFIGYLLMVPIVLGFYYTLPVSCVLFCLATWKLARVNRPFGKGFFVSLTLGAAGVAAIVMRLVPATQWLASYAEAACLLLALLWHCLILTGMVWVTEETGLSKLRIAAFRNRIYSAVYFALAAFLTAFDASRFSEEVSGFLRSVSVAFAAVGLVIFFLNGLLIWRAYAGICMPEDLNMPRKPSRFAFINAARARADAREEANLEEAKKKQKEYRERRLAELEAKKAAKKGRKK